MIMSLHAMSRLHGVDGLIEMFDYEALRRFGRDDRLMTTRAKDLAVKLHTNDTRATEPYINHPLRVALRIMTRYGVDDAEVVAAAVLHDCVEDHSAELAAGLDRRDDCALCGRAVTERMAALEYLSRSFSKRTARIVAGVTNPEFDRTTGSEADRYAQYWDHLRQLATGSRPAPIVVKLSDFTDNVTALSWLPASLVARLAQKYRPAIPIMLEALERPDLPLTPTVKQSIAAKLRNARCCFDGILAAEICGTR